MRASRIRRSVRCHGALPLPLPLPLPLQQLLPSSCCDHIFVC
jgi:hypothetical protein